MKAIQKLGSILCGVLLLSNITVASADSHNNRYLADRPDVAVIRTGDTQHEQHTSTSARGSLS